MCTPVNNACNFIGTCIFIQASSVAQLSEQAPFTSETVGSILAMGPCETSHSVNALPKVVGFFRALRFPPTGKVDRVG